VAGTPALRVRLSARTSLLFRRHRAEVGLVEQQNCPHRGRLVLGRNEEDGLRCATRLEVSLSRALRGNAQ